MALKLRRGLEQDRTSILPAEGELIYTTDQKQLFVGDGTTAGGTLVSSAVVSVNSKQGVVTIDTDDISEGTKKYFSNTLARAAISVTGGGTYDSGTGVINITGGGGGGTTYAISAETVSGGANLRLTGSDASTDNVKLAQGSNVTIVRTDANTITINSTSGVQVLDDLTDVDAASPIDGQALVWNNGTSAWQPTTVGSGVVDSAIANQIAFYSDSNTVTGDGQFTIDAGTGTLYTISLQSTFGLFETDTNTENLIISAHHDDVVDNTIGTSRSRGTRDTPTNVQFGDTLFNLTTRGYNDPDYMETFNIDTTVKSIVEPTLGMQATLSLGTAVVTLTTGDTSNLTEGQYVVKTTGTGAFGTSFGNALGDNPAYIVSIDSPTQITLNSNHTVAGAITFRSSGVIGTEAKFSVQSDDGHLRPYVRIKSDGSLYVGPDLGDFDGTEFTGRLQIASMIDSDHNFNKSAIRVISTGSNATGQEIAFTRARGTITEGGLGFSLTAVQTGDELGSLAFYGWYEPNPGGDNLESARIVAEVTGTPTGSAVPGKLRLQTANASGSMTDVLTLSSRLSVFAGMLQIPAYADETAAEASLLPGGPSAGMMYFDNGASKAKMYDGAAWQVLW